MKDLYTEYMDNCWQKHQSERAVWTKLDELSGERVWNEHVKLKKKLFEAARTNLEVQLRRGGASVERIREVDGYLNPEALTIGFARRFATYKRSTMIFRDVDRLKRIVNHPDRPVQFIFAGKSHPADHPGQ